MARIEPIDRDMAHRVARELGYTDEQIEVRGLVALNVFTGAFNLVAGIQLPARGAA